MASSRFRALRPVETVLLAELLMRDIRADRGEVKLTRHTDESDRAALAGSLTLDELEELCKPMPIGQGVGDLLGMKLVEKPRKSNEREVPDRLIITKLGEDTILRDMGVCVARFEADAKAKPDATEGAEIKARKAEWEARIKRVKQAMADLGELAAEPTEADAG